MIPQKLLGRLAFAWLPLLLLACSARPPVPDGTASDLGPLPQIDLREPMESATRHLLPNGLTLVVMERHQVPIVTVLAAVHSGAMVEDPEFDGLSHLYEHMFFKGNDRYPNQEAYMKRLRELGISFNGYTSTESVVYFFTMPKENIEQGLEFMNSALVTPRFDEEELAKERKVVLAEYDRFESRPDNLFYVEMNRHLFSTYYSRKNTIGNREVIASATAEKMRTLKERYYVPNNSILVIAGDVETRKVIESVEALFGPWAKTEDPFVTWPVPVHPPLTAHQYVVLEKPFQNILLAYGWHGPSVHKDREATYAADLFSGIVSLSGTSFQKNLVETGLFQSIELGYQTQQHVGPIEIWGVATPERGREAIDALEREIARFGDPEYFSDDDLATAKNRFAVHLLSTWEETLSSAMEISTWWCLADLDYRLGYIEKIQNVTREDIQRYLKTYVIGRPLVRGVLVDPSARKRVVPESWTVTNPAQEVAP